MTLLLFQNYPASAAHFLQGFILYIVVHIFAGPVDCMQQIVKVLSVLLL